MKWPTCLQEQEKEKKQGKLEGNIEEDKQIEEDMKREDEDEQMSDNEDWKLLCMHSYLFLHISIDSQHIGKIWSLKGDKIVLIMNRKFYKIEGISKENIWKAEQPCLIRSWKLANMHTPFGIFCKVQK